MKISKQDGVTSEIGANLDNDDIAFHCVVKGDNKENKKYDKNVQQLLEEFMIQ